MANSNIPDDMPKGAQTPSTVSGLQNVTQKDIARMNTADTRGILDTLNVSFVDVILGGFQSAAKLVGDAISNVAKALFGVYHGNDETMLVINDGMTAMGQNLENVKNVSGIGILILKDHHKFQGGSKFLRVPFDRTYGTLKKCSFDATNNRLILEKGTWTITPILAYSGGNTLLGDSALWAKLVVLDPAGNVFVEQYIDAETSSFGLTSAVPIPVVCTADGFQVSLMFRTTALWWTVWGGVNRTKLIANRWDIDTGNASLPTSSVTDEGAIPIEQNNSNFNVP